MTSTRRSTNQSTRPLKAGLRQQYGANVSGGSDAGHLLPLGRLRERGRRLPAAEVRGGLDPRACAASVPDNQLRPNALETANLRANVQRQRLGRRRRAAPTLGYISSNTRFVENDNSFLTITGSGEASGIRRRTSIAAGTSSRPSCSPSWPTRRPSGSPAGSPATGGRCLAHDPGHDRLRRGQPAPTSSSSPPARWPTTWTNRAGIRIDNRFQISQTSVDLGGDRAVPADADRRLQDVRRRPVLPRLRDAATSPPAAACRPGSETITGAGSTEASRHDRRVPLRRGLHRGGDRAQGAPVRHRRPPVRRQQRVRQELQRHGLPQGQRLLAAVGRAVLRHAGFINTLRLRGAPRRQRAAARHHRRAPVLHADLGAKEAARPRPASPSAAWATRTSSPSAPRVRDRASTPGSSRTGSAVELTYYNKRTKDALIAAATSPARSGHPRSQFFNLGAGQELRLRDRHQHPDHRQPRASPGT